jgi:hypothetical protein
MNGVKKRKKGWLQLVNNAHGGEVTTGVAEF